MTDPDGWAPSHVVTVNPANNHINGFSYDSAGNVSSFSGPGGLNTLTYNVHNRLESNYIQGKDTECLFGTLLR